MTQRERQNGIRRRVQQADAVLTMVVDALGEYDQRDDKDGRRLWGLEISLGSVRDGLREANGLFDPWVSNPLIPRR